MANLASLSTTKFTLVAAAISQVDFLKNPELLSGESELGFHPNVSFLLCEWKYSEQNRSYFVN